MIRAVEVSHAPEVLLAEGQLAERNRERREARRARAHDDWCKVVAGRAADFPFRFRVRVCARRVPARDLEADIDARNAVRLCGAVAWHFGHVVDVGVADSAVARAVLEVSDTSIIVMRECYVALRRAVRNPLTARASGIVVVTEPGRSLGPSDLSQVLSRPVIARIPTRDSVARAVDAGTLPTRLPEPLSKAAASILRNGGHSVVRRGAAA